MPRFLLRVALAIGALGLGCTVDTIPDGLRTTPPGDGPTVVFDLTRRPLPEIPAPNDVATFADPTSRTGRRINVSLVAPTELEQSARDGFSEMEGWGTFAPISVSFTRGKGTPAGQPAIDLERVRAHMRRDGHDFTDDPVYVINLRTGVPVMLDVGDGNFPVPIRDQDNYYANDPRASEQNIVLETAEEGAGKTAYDPALDTDFDGVLDHPDTLASLMPATGGVHGVDDLLTFYERETDTLILRPLLPMDEKTEYAVVLTDRLVDAQGRPVRSPFDLVYHPTQVEAAAQVKAILGDASRANYYGDLAGTGLDHVAFTWSFTTAPATEDLRLLRDGMFGQGPFARLATDFPPKVSIFRAAGLTRDVNDEPAWKTDPRCQTVSPTPYVVHIPDVMEMLHQVVGRVFSLSGPEETALEDSLKNVDHFVIGTYPLPYFLGDDPAHEQPTSRFHLNYRTGEGRVTTDVGHFWLSVPKARGAMKQPFPTVVWGHGTTLNGAEILIRAGYFARQGLAVMGFDGPGHGLVLDQGTQILAQGLLYNACLVPWIDALTSGRAHDLDGDGVADPGGLLWTANIFHSRDNIRQTVLDGIQAGRVLMSFDGRVGDQDYNDDGKPELAGDFDADGTPDVGGPLFSSGDSYGGIFAQIHAALDPNVVAGGSISGGGGLTDVAARSYGVVDSVIEQIITPLVIAVPASERSSSPKPGSTVCKSTQRSVRLVVNDLTHSREIEIACLDPGDLGPGMTVLVHDPDDGETRCARTGPDGRFRMPIPASANDRLQVQIFGEPDAVDSYGSCVVKADAPVGRAITTFEQPAAAYRPVADASQQCPDPAGCQQYRTTYYPVGSVLRTPQGGLGLRRQTPEVRKLLQLTQAALEPADPINYAPLYMLRPNILPDGSVAPPKPFLDSMTVADGFVVVATGHAFARAMGALPFLPPDALARMPDYADYVTPKALYDQLGGKTPNDVLIEHHALEGVARLAREPAGPSCAPNYVESADCTGSTKPDPTTCADTVFDPDWHAEGRDLYAAQHPAMPLRLAREATMRATDPDSLAASWAPRLLGVPFSDDGGYTPAEPLVGMMDAYISPKGEHVWTTANPCKAWDDAVYYDGVLARFFASRGTDLYYLSHPRTHQCLMDQSCDFLQP